MPSYDSTARTPFAKGGRVALKKGGVGKKLSDPNYGVKELPKKPKHLKRAKYDQEVDMGKVGASVRFRSKQAKRKGIKKIQSSKAYKDAGYHKQVEMLGGKAFKKGGLSSDKMKSEVKAAAKKKRDKLQARHKTPGGGLWNKPGPHKVDINRRTTEALLGKGKIQEKIIKFANKFDKPTYKKWRKQIVESQKKKGIGSGT